MPVADRGDNTFVVKHVFKDVKKMKNGETMDGPIENHFNIPWKIRISRKGSNLKAYLDCMVPADNAEWSISTTTRGITMGEQRYNGNAGHSKNKPSYCVNSHLWNNEDFLGKDDCVVEFDVRIGEVVGLNSHQKLMNFDDDSAKEDSDVTLIVKNQKFHVLKKYLAHHSAFFKTLFSENSEKSEIELKDIHPHDFQNYLELIYGECSLEGQYTQLRSFERLHYLHGILHLADVFDSKTAIRRCQEFLVQTSKFFLHEKFEAAVKYNLEELKTKCISDINSAADIKSFVYETTVDFSSDVWEELFRKAVSMIPE